MKLADNWQILCDTYDAGEELGLFSDTWHNGADGLWYHQLDEWQPIDRLAHLQALLSDTPYWGRELRWFNTAPWWYKNGFTVPETEKKAGAFIKFHGVDYYCKVWLNGEYLGGHEGYSSPFEFEVGHLLKYGEENLLFVKVWSPWDSEVSYKPRNCHSAYRGMIKGTYEHADTFVQRDVNPVGIWSDVEIHFHGGARFEGAPHIRALPSEDFSYADVKISGTLTGAADADIRIICRISEADTGKTVAEQGFGRRLAAGAAETELDMQIDSPRLWNTWDRGAQDLYDIEITVGGYAFTDTFGVRSLRLIRNEKEITYMVNGKKLYLRGTTYFPDNYISEMHGQRYRRDLHNITQRSQAGFIQNADDNTEEDNKAADQKHRFHRVYDRAA